MSTWLEDLKVGDTVVCEHRTWGASLNVIKVERLTATQIIAGGVKFHRRNGRQVGSSNEYNAPTLREATVELLQKAKRQRLQAKVEGIKAHNLTTDQLARIVAILAEAETQ